MIRIMKIVFVAILLASPSYGQTVLYVKDLPQLDWKMEKKYSLLGKNEQLSMSFSKASLKEDGSNWISLNDCSCTVRNDTVTVRISQSKVEGGIAVVLKLHKNKFESTLQHYSDIPEFEEEKYFINYPTTEENLVLEKFSLGGRKGLKGKLEVTSVPVATMNDKVFKYSGQFQCLIVKNNVR